MWIVASYALALSASPAAAFEPAHLEQLSETNQCPGCDLTEADLSHRDLAFADLTGANLVCADLTGSNLTQARMSGANLLGAILGGANMIGADLTGATLLRYALGDALRSDVTIAGAVLFRSMADGGMYDTIC